MQRIVNAAPTAGEGARLRRCLSAMVTAGIAAGYLTSPRLKEVHWQAGGRAAPGPQVAIAGESALFVDPAEIPAQLMWPGSAGPWPPGGAGTCTS